MNEKTARIIFCIAIAMACSLFFGGIGYMIYAVCEKVNAPVWATMIVEGLYVFSLIGLVLGSIVPKPVNIGNYYERKLL